MGECSAKTQHHQRDIILSRLSEAGQDLMFGILRFAIQRETVYNTVSTSKTIYRPKLF